MIREQEVEKKEEGDDDVIARCCSHGYCDGRRQSEEIFKMRTRDAHRKEDRVKGGRCSWGRRCSSETGDARISMATGEWCRQHCDCFLVDGHITTLQLLMP
ncbi:hypothetical protein L6452_37519 [Arctium lappa]|uniref:Uncharacterized protein n=1 Tax=Arctium lappa TaxID=4217 RepID=A0ACB8Y361_ARCLA|nr:hypothetical protein L6452_37519 [Arctium lappa]